MGPEGVGPLTRRFYNSFFTKYSLMFVLTAALATATSTKAEDATPAPAAPKPEVTAPAMTPALVAPVAVAAATPVAAVAAVAKPDVAVQPVAAVVAVQPVAPAGDPYGFTNWLNSVRAQYGLRAVGYDPNLTNWASVNNQQQASRGMGHFVMGPARRQNCAMGNYAVVGAMWMASPAHQAALLDPTISYIGIAGYGAYWTFNAY